MELRNAIGIDPESSGSVCALVKIGKEKVAKKKFYATKSDMSNFVKWAKKEKNTIIAIEGSNGQSTPLEKILREEGIVFYSFKPGDVDKFRQAVLGENKNNDRDAEATARYAMALESQGKLDRYKRVWFTDVELQGLTRSYAQKSKVLTGEINRLWKIIRLASTDLYLALGGRNSDIDINNNILSNMSILALFSEKPDIFEWKNLSVEEFSNLMGRNYKGRLELIKELQKVSKTFQLVSPATTLMIENSVFQILLLKQQMKKIVTMLEKATKHNKNVEALVTYKGISTLTASTIIAEIIDIRRFVKNGHLASYAGLVQKQHTTGDEKKGNDKTMRKATMYNRRLKNAFITAAKNFVKYNPDSHLSGYYKHLLKEGMSVTEARKRAARALVRVIYKKLYSVVEDKAVNSEESLKRESDMAKGISPTDAVDPSNISLLSMIQDNMDSMADVNRKISNF